ncbi:thiamine biosynthesis protein ThiS [Streptomyces daqingensis]|uniref:Thiamine biosynthesis protein ThiS n=1 Tax=Streptomyces daqingensis TaxID=1472640 RepID=A0ABQ2MKI0_9ACTN|nr:sulfur carrier protein ThiS [Streptomyces daqingensis]GGO53257.1 thiamine biosynthesis protein ThiS [Streptomyces daqingensis]
MTTSPSPSATVTLSVNGASRDVARGCTLGELVASFTAAPSGVAAAVNENVVPRGEWPARELVQGDRVEVLTAVQGG